MWPQAGKLAGADSCAQSTLGKSTGAGEPAVFVPIPVTVLQVWGPKPDVGSSKKYKCIHSKNGSHGGKENWYEVM